MACQAPYSLIAIFFLVHAPWSLGQVPDDAADAAAAGGSSRQLFAILGVDQQLLQHLTDGTELEAEEQETMVRILRRLNRFGDQAITRWRHDTVPWPAIAESPDPHRLEIYVLQGRVVSVRAYPLPAELRRRFELAQVYQLSLRVDSLEQPVTVFSVSVPERWRKRLIPDNGSTNESSTENRSRSQEASAGEILAWDENVRLSAWFVKLGGRHDQPTFLFATPRVPWFPDRPNPDLGVTVEKVALAAQGVDISRLDEVRDQTPLGAHDREAFYQLLAAVGADAAPTAVKGNATSHLQKLFVDPKTQRGNRFTFRGVARRALKIQVDDPDIRRRYGIDHYFELELFVGLDPSIRVLASQEDQTGKLFHAYPIAYCTRRLPEGMPLGEVVQEEVEVTGHFLKLWAYTTPYMDQPFPGEVREESEANDADRNQPKQVSPLLIGSQPVWFAREATAPPSWDWRWTAAAVVGLGVLYWALWHLTRSDRRHRQIVRQKRDQLPPNQTLDNLPDVPDGPEFSGLE